MTLPEIKAAVLEGKTVCWNNASYVVIRDSIGQWLIQYTPSGYCIGLTHRDETTMNGKESDFFIVEG